MKTRVILKNDDQENNEYKKGESGYIDGYVRGADDGSYVCVVIKDRIIMCEIHELQVIESLDELGNNLL